MAYHHHIFMIGWEYPPHNSGGLGVACEGITRALADQNDHIFFTLPYAHSTTISHMDVLCSPLASAENNLNLPPFSPYLVSSRIEEMIQSEGLGLSPDSQIAQQVSEYTEKVVENGEKLRREYEMIHAHDWMSFLAAMQLQQKLNKPFIAHVHSTEFDRIPDGNGSHYISHTEYLGLSQADKVIAVSEFTKNILIKKYFVDPRKIEVIHNGVYPVEKSVFDFLFAETQPVVVFMGRLTQQKGAEYFLQLAKSVLKKVPEALFIVAGDGDQYQYLLLKNGEQHLSASVLFTGFLRDKQREILLNRADVFVMPSVSEPFGIVALEAAQRNTPVIVSTNSGVKEILPSAIQADFWDVQKMTEQITKLLSDKTHWQSVVDGHHHDLASATWENTATKINHLYDQMGVQQK